MTAKSTGEKDEALEVWSSGLALLSQRGDVIGVTPTREELFAWARGKLHGKRAHEIDSHIARDPAVFDVAMDVRERVLREGRQQPSAFFPLASLAAAASLALFFVVLALQQTPQPQQVVEEVMRGTAQNLDWRLIAVRSGYQGESELTRNTTLLRVPDCADSGCSAAEELSRLGALVAEVESACSVPAAFTGGYARALTEVSDLLGQEIELVAWADYARGLAQRVAADDREAACAWNSDIVALVGRRQAS